ncbi:hypothetical protein V6N13_080635 [Hibiscus sabdariffa]
MHDASFFDQRENTLPNEDYISEMSPIMEGAEMVGGNNNFEVENLGASTNSRDSCNLGDVGLLDAALIRPKQFRMNLTSTEVANGSSKLSGPRAGVNKMYWWASAFKDKKQVKRNQKSKRINKHKSKAHCLEFREDKRKEAEQADKSFPEAGNISSTKEAIATMEVGESLGVVFNASNAVVLKRFQELVEEEEHL